MVKTNKGIETTADMIGSSNRNKSNMCQNVSYILARHVAEEEKMADQKISFKVLDCISYP